MGFPASKTAGYWIDKLKMVPHPEGGYFKETYRSEDKILKHHLPERFSGERHFSTGIYYLLQASQKSKLHRIKSDEMWHYYDGSGLVIYVIGKSGNLSERKLGKNFDNGENFQILIKAGDWFGATIIKPDSYCLAGCTVSPGFHFDDFEMGEKTKLLELFPHHKSIIESLMD